MGDQRVAAHYLSRLGIAQSRGGFVNTVLGNGIGRCAELPKWPGEGPCIPHILNRSVGINGIACQSFAMFLLQFSGVGPATRRLWYAINSASVQRHPRVASLNLLTTIVSKPAWTQDASLHTSLVRGTEDSMMMCWRKGGYLRKT